MALEAPNGQADREVPGVPPIPRALQSSPQTCLSPREKLQGESLLPTKAGGRLRMGPRTAPIDMAQAVRLGQGLANSKGPLS